MSRLFWNNPVLLRELQERVLSLRTMVILTVWVVVLCGTTALYYAGEATTSFGNQFGPFGNSVLEIATVGQNMFDWILFFMMGLVLFLVPGFTAASIAGERERQTLLPMQVTLLRPIDIVIGKISASVVFVLVLIAVTVPILAFAYVIGGITIREVFTSLALLTFSALALACITVACSAIVRRVPAAIVTAYGVVLLMSVGSLVLFGIAHQIDSSRGFDVVNPPQTLLAVNPVVALAAASGDDNGDEFFYGPETPMAALRELIGVDDFNQFDEFGFARGGGVGFAVDAPVAVEAPAIPVPVPPGPDAAVLLPDGPDAALIEQVQFAAQPVPQNPNLRVIDAAVPFVAQYLIAMTALSMVSIWVAARRLRTPAKVER